MNNDFNKKYDLQFYHSGGGCYHLIKELKKGYFLVNTSTTDVGGDHNEVPTEENQNCHFGVYNDDMDEIENFYDPFIIGYEKILKKYN